MWGLAPGPDTDTDTPTVHQQSMPGMETWCTCVLLRLWHPQIKGKLRELKLHTVCEEAK